MKECAHFNMHLNDEIDEGNSYQPNEPEISAPKTVRQALVEPRPERSIESWAEDVGEGWRPLVRGLDANLREIDPDYEILQLKEKFSALRYYFSSSKYDKLNGLVEAAERISESICEECGAPGESATTPPGHWLKTLCPLCRKQRESKG